MHFYITRVISKQFSGRDFKPMAFLVFFEIWYWSWFNDFFCLNTQKHMFFFRTYMDISLALNKLKSRLSFCVPYLTKNSALHVWSTKTSPKFASPKISTLQLSNVGTNWVSSSKFLLALTVLFSTFSLLFRIT